MYVYYRDGHIVDIGLASDCQGLDVQRIKVPGQVNGVWFLPLESGEVAATKDGIIYDVYLAKIRFPWRPDDAKSLAQLSFEGALYQTWLDRERVWRWISAPYGVQARRMDRDGYWCIVQRTFKSLTYHILNGEGKEVVHGPVDANDMLAACDEARMYFEVYLRGVKNGE